MRRSWAVIGLALAMVVLALMLAACGGGDDDDTTTGAAPSASPSAGATPPSLSSFPPEFIDCLADQGIDVESLDGESLSDAIHSPEGQACFDVLHQGGATP